MKKKNTDEFIDQMVLYAAMRSSQKNLSFGLNAIGKTKLKGEKLDYTENTVKPYLGKPAVSAVYPEVCEWKLR